MVLKFEHPEKIEAEVLRKSVLLWTILSPIKILVELIAWGLALWALVRLV